MSFPAVEAQPQAKKSRSELRQEFNKLLNATLDDLSGWETSDKNKLSMKLQALGADTAFRHADQAGNEEEMAAQLERLSDMRDKFGGKKEAIGRMREEIKELVAEAERMARERPDFAVKAQRVKDNTEVMLERLEEENYPTEQIVEVWDALKLIGEFLRVESLKSAAEA